MIRASRVLMVIAFLVFAFAWPATYGVLRLTHYFTHTTYFTSEEGWNPQHWHGIEGHEDRQSIFKPLIAVELWCWEHWKP
ncbi:MAG: hypothetical protein JNM17_21025 [Archangium sp.]|nr:hypothetical protein [Archangium sp.]